MEAEKNTIRGFIRQLSTLPVVHDWTLESPSQPPLAIKQPQNSIGTITLQVNVLQSKKLYSVSMEMHQTIHDLKQRLYQMTHIATEEQRLVVNGRTLKDSQTLEHELPPNPSASIIHLIRVKQEKDAAISDDKIETRAATPSPDVSTTQTKMNLGISLFHEFSEFLLVKYGKDQGTALIESFREDYNAWMKQINH